MKIKVLKKLGKETTIRAVCKNDNTIIGLIGTVGDFIDKELFSKCDAPIAYWACIFNEDKNGEQAIFASTREELLQRLLNYKL